jgi:hypothetical protein
VNTHRSDKRLSGYFEPTGKSDFFSSSPGADSVLGVALVELPALPDFTICRLGGMMSITLVQDYDEVSVQIGHILLGLIVRM